MTKQDVLKHFGILGMKWGKRKAKKATIKPFKRERVSEDYSTKELLKKKKLPTLTNAEIKRITERLQLERQFKELTKEQMSPGKKFVMDILQNVAKEAATNFIKKHVNKAISR